jgi:hypothetical protein
MRPKLTTKQLESCKRLLNELNQFVNKRYGSVKNIMILTHKMLPEKIIIKYEKIYVMGGEYEYEYPISTIDQDGKIDFIDNNFKDVFARSAFLSECLPLDINDSSQYQQID